MPSTKGLERSAAVHAAGHILAVTATAGGESWTYGYDDLDRLTSATNTTTPALSQSWTYDSVDNMTSNSVVGSYTYPLPGAPRPHAVTATPLGAYVYDANGNMTSAAGDTLVYDGENRPVSVNAVTFAYGPGGGGACLVALPLGPWRVDPCEAASGVRPLSLPRRLAGLALRAVGSELTPRPAHDLFGIKWQ